MAGIEPDRYPKFIQLLMIGEGINPYRLPQEGPELVALDENGTMWVYTPQIAFTDDPEVQQWPDLWRRLGHPNETRTA